MIKDIEVTITMPMEFPDDWDDEMIEFHLNESSWCYSNFLNQLNDYAKKNNGCICCLCNARVKREGINNE